MPDADDGVETRVALDELDREMRKGSAEMHAGFSTVATGMAQITALLTDVAGPQHGSSCTTRRRRISVFGFVVTTSNPHPNARL